jgi:membrane protease YdiL (CAAX protease family)
MATATNATPLRRRGVLGFIQRHPYLSFLLTFNILGQAVAFVPVVLHRVYGIDLNIDWVVVVPTLLFLLLPALVITRIARGADGLRALLRSMTHFRVRARWWLLPLVAVPALTVVTALPAPPGLTAQTVIITYLTIYLPALLGQFVTTNWWEETVWMGFFQTPLQDRFGPWRAVLITTPFFALEHLSLVFGGTLSEGLIQFGLILLVTLPTRALLAWIYNRTGSIALVGLVHASTNAAGLALVPQLLGHPGGGGSALLVLGVIVIVATRSRLGRETSRNAVSLSTGASPSSARATAT